MTYAVGQKILASDYNNARGALDALTAYPDDAAATYKLAALIGVGYGQRGYGQNIAFPAAVVGNKVTAAQFNLIRSVMNLLNVHTGAGLTLQPIVSVGGTIIANDGTSGRPSLSSLIVSLDNAKHNYAISQMGLTSELTSTRTTAWNTEIYHEFTLDFGTEDRARYFFNSGGTLYASASRTGGSATQINTALTNLLTQMGTVKFNYNSTTYTGTGGTVYPIGYYGLTSTYQTLFSHSGSGYYVPLTYTLKARRESYTGSNGGNGSLVRMQAIFNTGLSSYYSLDGTLTSNISELKENGLLTIQSPTYTTVFNLSQNPGHY